MHALWLAQFAVQLTYTYLILPTHNCCAHIVLGSVLLLYIYTLDQPLFTLGLCATALYNCTLGSASLAFDTILQNQFTDVR